MTLQSPAPSLTSRPLLLGLVLTATGFLFGPVQAAAAQNTVVVDAPVGFAAVTAARQSYCEARFVELPSGDTFREHLRIITANPHPTGSSAQIEVGHYLSRVMRAAGLNVREYPYDLYLPQLTDDVEAHIVTPVALRLNNREPALQEDRFSGHPDLLNGWNAFSGSGDVTGEVVYANQGTRADYRALDSMGVSIEGKIVVARYGGNFRGFKVLFAEERGAAGVIMFNDAPVVEEDPYPEGPMLNGDIIQRGSVLTAWEGDPLTPFEPALPVDGPVQVDRLDPAEVGLPAIPVLPVGYHAASEILSRMTGDVAPDAWQGGLDLAYRLTGGDALTVRVRVNQPKALTRATNVVGTIEGSEFPDEWIILGSHYDPWGFGAVDPNSGTAMLLTLAEALGELAEEGCRPRRSILIAHWDAEEYGVIGSSEWVEELIEPLTTGAVAYINADAAVSGGNFGSLASPSLKQPILDAIRDTPYPEEHRSVYDWLAERSEGGVPALGDLGGGSDHIAFYTHAGVPSAGINSRGRSGVAHSNYDNFAWFERFGDPEWIYGPMVATVDGLLSMRLANADLLPYDVTRYALDTRRHVNTLLEVAEYRRIEVDLTRLVAATTDLERAATALHDARAARVASGPVPSSDAERINAAFIGLEKAWLDDRGLQDRPWSRSLYVSPDPFSGYASWMLPGLRYEIETDDPGDVPEWEGRYLDAVRRLAERMDDLTALIEGR